MFSQQQNNKIISFVPMNLAYSPVEILISLGFNNEIHSKFKLLLYSCKISIW